MAIRRLAPVSRTSGRARAWPTSCPAPRRCAGRVAVAVPHRGPLVFLAFTVALVQRAACAVEDLAGRLAAEFTLLAELGSDCHLTGDVGDSLLHPHGYLADLARSGRWLRLAGHALGWARLQRCSPWTLLAASLSQGRTAAAVDWLTPQAIELAAPDDGGSGPTLLDVNTRTLQEVQTVGRTARADAQLAEAF